MSEKQKFLSSKKWRDWRRSIFYKDEGKDYVTGKKLRRGNYNCHHLDLRKEHYQDLNDENRFLSLNRMTHDFCHWAYQYWIKDPLFLDRIEDVLERMKAYSND